MRGTFAAAVLIAGLSSPPAWACSDPPEAYDRRISDRVIEGRIRCNRDTDQCRIEVSRSLKPSDGRGLGERTVDVEADYRLRASLNREGTIIVTCAGPFAPRNTDFYGRFYLQVEGKTGLYKVRRYDVRDRDGRYYLLGIKCEPDVDEPGSQTCDFVGGL